MTVKLDLYAVLGLAPDADIAAIRKAYRALSKQHHPDAGGSKEKFEELKLAFDVLSEPAARSTYDRTGEYKTPGADQRQSIAVSMIASAFGEVLMTCIKNRARLKHQNLPEMIAQHLHKDVLVLEQSLPLARKSHAELIEAQKRFRRRGGGSNILGSIAATKIGDIAKEIADMEECLEVTREAITIARSHVFDKELMIASGSVSDARQPFFYTMKGRNDV